jgi:hypothetical protein
MRKIFPSDDPTLMRHRVRHSTRSMKSTMRSATTSSTRICGENYLNGSMPGGQTTMS